MKKMLPIATLILLSATFSIAEEPGDINEILEKEASVLFIDWDPSNFDQLGINPGDYLMHLATFQRLVFNQLASIILDCEMDIERYNKAKECGQPGDVILSRMRFIIENGLTIEDLLSFKNDVETAYDCYLSVAEISV